MSPAHGPHLKPWPKTTWACQSVAYLRWRGRSTAITILRNREPCHGSTCQRQACGNQNDHSESKYKCFPNRLLDDGFRGGIETSRNSQSGKFDFVCLKLLHKSGREQYVSQVVVQTRTKGLHHDNAKNCNSKDARDARHCIIDSRSGADSVLIHTI